MASLISAILFLVVVGTANSARVKTKSSYLGLKPDEQGCDITDLLLRIDYTDNSLLDGSFEYRTVAAWNHVPIAVKTYEPNCEVTYSVACRGASVTLHQQDSCGQRTAFSNFYDWSLGWSSYYATVTLNLEEPSLYNGYTSKDTDLSVVLPEGHKHKMVLQDSTITISRITPSWFPWTTEEIHSKVQDFRYFTMLPRANTCEPDEGTPFITGPMTHLKHNADKCGACLDFTKGVLAAIRMSVNDTAESADPCSNAPSRESVKSCEAFSQELKKEIPNIEEDFQARWDFRGSLMSSEVASTMACQDIGCCPLDPEIAKEFAEIIDEEASLGKELDSVQELGAVNTFLHESPEARRVLEATILHLSATAPPADGKKPTKIPTHDSECVYDFSKRACANPEVCKYEFKFGDMTFSNSCRLAVKAVAPTEDSECLFDKAAGSCAHPDVCEKRCSFGDMTSNACCKIKKEKQAPPPEEKPAPAPEDASEDDEAGDESDDTAEDPTEPEGTCLRPEDRATLALPTVKDDMTKIGTSCFSVWKMNIDHAKSLKGHIALGLSENCAGCFVDYSRCIIGTSECFRLLSTRPPTDPEAMACLEKYCNPTIRKCTGLTAEELPQ